jgi:preprotein translocase subunit SecG
VIEVVLMIHFIVAFLVIVLVLLQQGKGASMGAAFGGGASATLFGSRGPASFLMKLTSFLVIVFFVTSLTLAYLASKASLAESGLQAPSLVTEPHAHVPLIGEDRK